ncbi:nitric oxide synthase oxygenase [Micromonospora aurantiaca]|uniref:nitric oxide synthase oxygenase n=1 Tax=Micromonospora aurantiaca (nom. illeg.) TaxID=47850 RepID=UPI000F3C50FD|nr:nitric oxide synthase oxygenase [Micromonospora aurantiaca]RNH97786.1 nitric oxide synthase oxygenase [Micromonospora aurantiaca]
MTTTAVTYPSTPPTQDTVIDEAHAFLHLLHQETGQPGFARRWRNVRAEIAATGTWRHTSEELTFGARVAWRNSARCIGRLRWQSLHVRDRRNLTSPEDARAEFIAHLRQATNGGCVRSVVTILAPALPDGPPPIRIINPQLVRYAAWPNPDGTVIGDPANRSLTQLALDTGWPTPPTRGPHDILPWLVATDDNRLHALPVDPTAVLEVRIHHPQHAWIGDLGLRWPAVPVISNMLLSIGGVIYPAPFNGFFMASEIAVRNLADNDRYGKLSEVVTRLHLDENDRLRHDKALIVLQEAVLHSFETAGVTITDHHRESAHFARFVRREEAAGRTVVGDWSWLNSYPMTPQDPSWQRYYSTATAWPVFRPDPSLAGFAGHADPTCPHAAATFAAAHQRAAPSTAAATCPRDT